MTEKEFRFPELMWSHTDNAVGRKISEISGKITKETNLIQENGLIGEIKKPISLRSERADVYKEVKKIKKEEDRCFSKLEEDTQESFDEAELSEEEKKIKEEENKQSRKESFDKANVFFDKVHELDNLFSQVLYGRKSVEVEIEGLGKQSSEFVELKSKKVDLEKPPIVLVLGISNDLDGVGEFPIKLAMISKRRVFVFTYPESWHGKVTREFGEAVEKSNNFGPHTEFFKSAINQVVGSETEIDICGVSAGSIMVSELTKDKKFNNRTNQINLIVPPGIVGMNTKSLIKGLSREVKSLIFNKNDGRKISILNPEKIRKTDEERANGFNTSANLRNKLSQEYSWWNNELLSGKGRQTKVIICEQDGVTNGVDGLEKVSKNPNLKVFLLKKSSHGTPGSNPERVIEQMII